MKMNLILGDWSSDGHGISEKFTFEVNKTVRDVQDAYKASCRLTGISFNNNEDYTGTNRNYLEADKYRICVEYENTKLSPEVISILEKFNCPTLDTIRIDDDPNVYVEDQYCFIDLWWWFVKLSLPDVEYVKVTDETPNINGFWNYNLNVQFGYGLYYN